MWWWGWKTGNLLTKMFNGGCFFFNFLNFPIFSSRNISLEVCMLIGTPEINRKVTLVPKVFGICTSVLHFTVFFADLVALWMYP